MKRMIKAGWYVGEPNTWSKSKNGKSRSYYSNPPDWEEKQHYVLAFLDEVYNNNENMDKIFYPNPGTTPWIVQVQFKVDGPGNYYKFDLWEDEMSLEDQEQEFLDIVGTYLDFI